jgi:hypothetical protein
MPLQVPVLLPWAQLINSLYPDHCFLMARTWYFAIRRRFVAFRDAETHYCEAGTWKAAVKMYRRANQWEDVVRVAKAHGGVAASKQVCNQPVIPVSSYCRLDERLLYLNKHVTSSHYILAE